MTNTPYKRKAIPGRIKNRDAIPRLLSAPATLYGGPWKAGLMGADSTPAARRVLVLQHAGGSFDAWLASGDAVTLGAQNYPETGVWREVSKTRCELAPGCQLEAHVVAVRSGLAVWYEAEIGGAFAQGWHTAGPQGRIRITVDFENLSANTSSVSTEIAIPPSLEDDAAEPTAAGSSWSQLIFEHVKLLATSATINKTAAELVKWSENTTVWVTIEHQGGVRVIQCAVQEVPFEHVVEDQEEAEVSIHGWPVPVPGPSYPQTEARDGPDYEEHRFGTARALKVAGRQGSRLGPVIARWTAYREDLAEVTDTAQDPIQVTSTTFVGLSVGSAITSWSADAPGYPMAGHYALRAPENLSTRLDGAGTIPVRIWVEARFSGTGSNTGTIRFQASARSWVDLEVDQSVVATTWTELEVTGWLESAVAPDDAGVLLIDLAKTTGGTLEVRNWSVSYGEHAIAT